MAVSPGTPLCLVRLTYLAPLETVDVHRPPHVEWLKRMADAGLMLAAGRTDPPTGGVLLFRGQPAEVEPLVQTDPFVAEGVASAEVVAFRVSVTTPELAALL